MPIRSSRPKKKKKKKRQGEGRIYFVHMVLTLLNVKAIQCGGLSGDVMQRLAAMLNFLSSWKPQGCFQVYRITMSTFPAQKMLPLDMNPWHHILLSICVIKLKQDWNVFSFVCLVFKPLNTNVILYDSGMSLNPKPLLCVPNHIRHHDHDDHDCVRKLGHSESSPQVKTKTHTSPPGGGLH